MKCSVCGSEMVPINGHCSVCGTPVLLDADFEEIENSNCENDKRSGNNANHNIEKYENKKKKHSNTAEEYDHESEKHVKIENKSKTNSSDNGTTKKVFHYKKLILGFFAALLVFALAYSLIAQNSVSEDEEKDIASTEDVSYNQSPTKLLQADGVIYNDAGGELKGLYDTNKFSYRFSYNKDHSMGAFVDNRDNALFVTCDLKTTPVAINASRAGIAFDGHYMFAITTAGYSYILNVIDLESQDKYTIDEGVTNCAVLSPDGSKVGYLKFTGEGIEKNLYIAEIGSEPELVVEGADYVRALSNDGNTVFFQILDEEYRTHEYVWHEGEVFELAGTKRGYLLFNRDCSEVLFRNDDKNYYYIAGMDKPELLDCGEFNEVIIDAAKDYVNCNDYDAFIYDTESFAGGLICDFDGNTYLIKENYDLELLGHSFTREGIHVKKADKNVYIVEIDKEIIKYEVDELGNIDKKIICSGNYLHDIEANDDASSIWYMYIDSGDTLFVQVDEAGNSTLLYRDDYDNGVEKFYWDTDSKKLYILTRNNVLKSLSVEGEERVLSDSCKRMSLDDFEYPGILVFTDTNGSQYGCIFGRLIELSD